jgi:hypothetical protein
VMLSAASANAKLGSKSCENICLAASYFIG